MVKYIFFNIYVNTRGYPWIPANMKKIGGYSHNKYVMDMGTGTRRIFIQRIGYGGATTCTLPAPLTSLLEAACISPILVENIKFMFHESIKYVRGNGF